MPITRIRPNGTSTAVAAKASNTGGGSLHGALSDQSDATYVKRTSSGSPMVALDLGPVSVAAGSDIVTVVPGFRYKKTSGSKALKVALARAVSVYTLVNGVPTLTHQLYYAPWLSTSAIAANAVDKTFDALSGPELPPLGGTWNAGSVGALLLVLDDLELATETSKLATIYDAFADVHVLERPAATCQVIDGDGSVACGGGLGDDDSLDYTTRPTLKPKISAIVEAWQVAGGGSRYTDVEFHWRVFASAVYLQPGFDPQTSVDFVDSGYVTLSASVYGDGATPAQIEGAGFKTSAQLGRTLTYRVYTWARRVYGSAAVGTAAYEQFTVNTTVTPTPSIAAAVQAANGRVAITATPVSATGHADPRIRFMRSLDAGGTWTDVRGADDVAGAFGVATTVHDYETPRGVAVVYGARVTTTLAGGEDSAGAIAVSGAVTLPHDGWWFKVPQAADPTAVNARVRVVGTPEATRGQDFGLFRPQGRQHPIIVHGALQGRDGAYTVKCTGASEIAALEAVLALQGPVYVEDGFGAAKWVEFLLPKHVLRGTLSNPRRAYELGYVEVAGP